MSGLKDNILPRGNPLNNNGELTLEFRSFLERSQKFPHKTVVPDLGGAATLSDVIDRINLLSELLEKNGLLERS